MSETTETLSCEDHLANNIKGETWEVTHYLAMALKAENDGMPEVGAVLRKIAIEEAEHGARFIYLGGEISDLQAEVEKMLSGEEAAYDGKHEGMKQAEAAGKKELASFFDTAAHDEGRHAAMLRDLLKRYF